LTGTLEGGRPLVSVTVGAYAPESEVAALLSDVERSSEGVSIGSYPFFKDGRGGSNFVVRSEEMALANAAASKLGSELASLGFEPVEGGI